MRRPVQQLRTVLEMIQFEHTIFALPFALLGMMLAAAGWPQWSTVGWIVVAMVGARSAAMAFNRLVDRKIDARNPRTAGRELPAGRVSAGFVAAFVVASAALLVFAAWRLNPLALALSPLALFVALGYSFTKRFTSGSHFVLGLALAGAPMGAWVAVTGSFDRVPALLGLAVALWVAGFDILYSLQDVEFDRAERLHSVPRRFGVVGALSISALCHAAMVLLLALLPRWYDVALGAGYWTGVAGCALLLFYQHWIVRPADLSRIDAAFFRANGLLSVWLFGAVAFDLLVLS